MALRVGPKPQKCNASNHAIAHIFSWMSGPLSVGLCMYFCYGICHSTEAQRFSFKQPDEERILLPSIPEQAMHEEFLNGQKSNRQNIGYKDFHEEP